MTFALAWKYRSTVYFIADSLATTPNSGGSGVSTFGEIIGETTGQFEGVNKIMCLGPRASALGVGDGVALTAVVRRARDLLAQDTSLSTIAALTDARRSVQFWAASLLFVGEARNGTVTLTVWHPDASPEIIEDGPVSAGTWAPELRTVVKAYCLTIPRWDDDAALRGEHRWWPDEVLAVLTSICQCLSIHFPGAASGVGGAFVGAALGNDGHLWMEPTIFMVHQPLSADAAEPMVAADGDWLTGLVHTRVVDGSLEIQSTISASRIAAEQGQSLPRDGAHEALLDPRLWAAARYFCMLDRSRWRLVIIESSPIRDRQAVRVHEGEATLGVEVEGWVEDLLRKQAPPAQIVDGLPVIRVELVRPASRLALVRT